MVRSQKELGEGWPSGEGASWVAGILGEGRQDEWQELGSWEPELGVTAGVKVSNTRYQVSVGGAPGIDRESGS